jgi:hypothetical protein
VREGRRAKAGTSGGHGYASSGPPPSLRELTGVELPRARDYRQRGEGSTLGWGLMPGGELAVRSKRCADGVILWLSGELDRATAALLERELGRRPGRSSHAADR